MQTASRVYAQRAIFASHLTSLHGRASILTLNLPLSCFTQVRLDSLSLNLSDSALWMAMDTNLLQSVTPLPTPQLKANSLHDHSNLSASTEAQLKQLIDDHRKGLKLNVPGVEWDEQLSHQLSPALSSYEAERIGGYPIGQQLFGDAIKRAVPAGHTFKGWPQHFITADAGFIFKAWMQSGVASDIIKTRSYKASLAVRVRVFPIAEEVVSVWAMLAVAYRPE